MATVNFLFRSIKEKAPIAVRLLHTENEVNYVFGARTEYKVEKAYWDRFHKMKRIKDVDMANYQLEVQTELNQIKNFILTAFDEVDVTTIKSDWLKSIMHLYYNPSEELKSIPEGLTDYFTYYLDYRKNELRETSVKKYKVVQRVLERMESALEWNILVKDVNDRFKVKFDDYCKNENYSPNTIQRALVSIKTVCKHARFLGMETHPQLDSLRLEREKVSSIYLTPDEIERIRIVELNEKLDTARDWLLISCYTGQRVSDFLNFSGDMIRIENGKTLLEFTQKKTGKIMTIPLSKEVRGILEKRSGEFPKSISDVNYNKYIKEVCQLARINEKVRGAKKMETEEGSGIYRRKEGVYSKYELISSHVGRRSFATNNYGRVPTSFLIYMTGHSTEAMFLAYIHKSNKDLAIQVADYFE